MARARDKSKIRRPAGERALYVFIYVFFTVLCLLIVLPLMNLVSKSFSGENAILSGRVGILPDFTDVHLDAYRLVFQNQSFLRGMLNTVLVTVVGTVAAILTTALAAYTLSKPYLRGRKWFNGLCMFVMVFNGGLIPTYLVMDMLGLLNTFNILWMAGAFSVYNMMVLRNFFASIPLEMEEAAMMDGAGHARILFRIYMPLSKASLAVITLFYAVDYWNNFYTAMIYTTRTELKTLQLVLKDIIYSVSDVFRELYASQALGQVTSQSTIAACVVVASIPIMLVYPFLQRYFTKGVMVGSVKG